MVYVYACSGIVSDDSFLNDAQKKFVNDTGSLKLKKERLITLFALDSGLREIYGTELRNMDILRRKGGKPYFQNKDVFFNLSHTDSFGVCALSDFEVGVDAEEKTRDISDSLQKRFPDVGNICDWTRREAYGKMLGDGFFAQRKAEHFFRTYFAGNYIITACSEKDEFANELKYVRGGN